MILGIKFPVGKLQNVAGVDVDQGGVPVLPNPVAFGPVVHVDVTVQEVLGLVPVQQLDEGIEATVGRIIGIPQAPITRPMSGIPSDKRIS